MILVYVGISLTSCSGVVGRQMGRFMSSSRFSIVISGCELFVLFCPGDAIAIVVRQDCLFVDCIGRSGLMVCELVWIPCGFMLSLTVCGCGSSLYPLGLSLFVVAFGSSCSLSLMAECFGDCLSDFMCT